MSKPKRPYREGTRAARCLIIRDAILPRLEEGRSVGPGMKEIAVGPFLIFFAVPGAMGYGRGYNLEIWPNGAVNQGYVLQGHKVANFDWNQSDEVEILSFRSGAWEKELLELLRAPVNVSFMPRR